MPLGWALRLDAEQRATLAARGSDAMRMTPFHSLRAEWNGPPAFFGGDSLQIPSFSRSHARAGLRILDTPLNSELDLLELRSAVAR